MLKFIENVTGAYAGNSAYHLGDDNYYGVYVYSATAWRPVNQSLCNIEISSGAITHNGSEIYTYSRANGVHIRSGGIINGCTLSDAIISPIRCATLSDATIYSGGSVVAAAGNALMNNITVSSGGKFSIARANTVSNLQVEEYGICELYSTRIADVSTVILNGGLTQLYNCRLDGVINDIHMYALSDGGAQSATSVYASSGTIITNFSVTSCPWSTYKNKITFTAYTLGSNITLGAFTSLFVDTNASVSNLTLEHNAVCDCYGYVSNVSVNVRDDAAFSNVNGSNLNGYNPISKGDPRLRIMAGGSADNISVFWYYFWMYATNISKPANAVNISVVSTGKMLMDFNCSASTITIYPNGNLYMRSANATYGVPYITNVVNSGGVLNISNGSVDNVLITAGGFLSMYNETDTFLYGANHLTIQSNGYVLCYNGISNTVVSNKGKLDAASSTTHSASAFNISVASGGQYSNGGIHDATTVDSGGICFFLWNTGGNVINNGYCFVNSSATVSNMLVGTTGALNVINGTLINIDIKPSGFTNFSTGLINSITVSSTGSLYVSSGGVASNVISLAGAVISVFTGGSIHYAGQATSSVCGISVTGTSSATRIAVFTYTDDEYLTDNSSTVSAVVANGAPGYYSKVQFVGTELSGNSAIGYISRGWYAAEPHISNNASVLSGYEPWALQGTFFYNNNTWKYVQIKFTNSNVMGSMTRWSCVNNNGNLIITENSMSEYLDYDSILANSGLYVCSETCISTNVTGSNPAVTGTWTQSGGALTLVEEYTYF